MSETNSNLGFTDQAAMEDKFGIPDYIKGLSDFIEKCNTPMTISIQGSWGTGKTSIMNLVNNSLTCDDRGHELPDSKVKTIWFNTWQFSQFNMDEQLATSLLTSLIAEFKLENESTQKEAKSLISKLRFGGKIAYNVGKDVLVSYVESVAGSKAAEKFEDGMDTVAKKANEYSKGEKSNFEQQQDILDKYIDTTSAIKELKNTFEKCVKQMLKEKSKDRIVVFIDDLDRLEPRKAVELLEVLKLFLDCKDCVFVLAIDYDVVAKGVEAKYGDLSNKKTDADEKGRSFFDKIIQVPFKMPVARYQISDYVEYCFKQIGMPIASEEDKKTYEDLIKCSIGTNPRAMKRLFNSFQLLTMVVKDTLTVHENPKQTEKNKQLLFAALCLQHCNENVYNFIVRNCNSPTKEQFTKEQFLAIVNGKYDELKENTNKSELDLLREDDLNKAGTFMALFSKAIDTDNSGEIDDKEFDMFREVISFSAITAATDSEEQIERKRNPPSQIKQEEITFEYKENNLDNLNGLLTAIDN